MRRGNLAGKEDYVVVECTDPAELSTILSGTETRVTVKPTASSGIQFRCEYAAAELLGLALCRYQGSAVFEHESANEKYLIFLPRYGFAAINVNGARVLTSPRQGAIVACQQAKSLTLSGPMEHLVVVVDRATLSSRLMDMLEVPVSGGFDFFPEIDLTAGPGLIIAQTAAALHSGLAASAALRNAPVARTSFANALVELLLESLPHRHTSELNRRTSPMPRHVKRAVEFMRANLSKPLTIQEIALASGSGIRSLQDGFRRFKQTTPSSYLQYLRLDAVHQELLQAKSSQTVCDIARKWGFSHFGRFAADYRKRFGQAPSQTLQSSSFRIRPPG
ncbi:helix-turn-helix domain-containing protein [Sinorhizobium fredii]|uniref:helix-turn-helix domain-containing protein n=1 Tax=Rhizobium fredii TaxID=380 RepID=UPI000559C23F|nr:AraC family transcriptional regulator [Sinorhizobium fredii]UTY48512.1 AraC family transcriptional regulator [Sinorhizobium fredii]